VNSQSAPAKLAPGRKLGRYELVKKIGAGAFGEVWLAIDAGLHGFRKQVALKILARDVSERRISSLIREARICGHLSHPNIISVFGVEREDDLNFIVMEYVEGETVASLWSDLEFMGTRVPRAIILDIGIALAEALHHAWTATNEDGEQLNIVHRDLKPANVLIASKGVLKVGDFGVAKLAPDLDSNHTRAGKLKGTPSYLAPELWRGDRNFRPGMDLWSMGLILWELAAGERFYQGAKTLDIYKIIKSRSPEEEVDQIRSYMPQLADILLRLLQRDPDDRFQNAFEVAEQLRWVRMSAPMGGDLIQFTRLVRAGRVDPEERRGSLASLPALPAHLDDWAPLFALAKAEAPPMAPPPPEPPKPPGARKGVVIGPEIGGEFNEAESPAWKGRDALGSGTVGHADGIDGPALLASKTPPRPPVEPASPNHGIEYDPTRSPSTSGSDPMPRPTASDPFEADGHDPKATRKAPILHPSEAQAVANLKPLFPPPDVSGPSTEPRVAPVSGPAPQRALTEAERFDALDDEERPTELQLPDPDDEPITDPGAPIPRPRHQLASEQLAPVPPTMTTGRRPRKKRATAPGAAVSPVERPRPVPATSDRLVKGLMATVALLAVAVGVLLYLLLSK
jgi:serine/threonine protein kinase